jgi:hypothetical protein
MLRGLTNQDLDRRRLCVLRLPLLNDSLDGIAQQFANDILEVT